MSPSQLIANRFEIQDLLGRGGMGDVYRATDTQTGETVAVKALNPEVLERDPSLLERFVREGEALRQLNHPNIVRMIAAVEEDGRHYLVMEYVEDGSLRELLLSRGNLPASEVVKIALEVSDALTRAHHLKIIHRDLKPANVLLAKDNTPRLADFGIAHIQDSSHLTQSGTLIGTVDYLSPEICQGESPEERSDIWAFGVMLFEMLSGKLPFEGKSMTAKITAILHQPIPDLTKFAPNIPNALVDLVYRMLEKDPLQRIPSVRLVGAELEAILKGRESVTPVRVISTPPVRVLRHNLPMQITTFVGRENEKAEITQALAEHRLVTLTGPGGVGKTRLSLEVGADLLDQFPSGIWFIELAPITNPELIPQTILTAAEMQTQQGRTPLDSLIDFLREKKTLLILDNCEHLVEACAKLTNKLLTSAPNLKILASSREALGVKGEQAWQVPSLSIPDLKHPSPVEQISQYEAVRLFIDRARLVQHHFTVTDSNASAIAQICHRLDGIPLAIELASARLRTLSVEEIASRLDDCFRLLTGGSRTVLPRQQTLRALIDWSYDLLPENERVLLQRLSMFSGGCTFEAVEQVCSDERLPVDEMMDVLTHLIEKSLLMIEEHHSIRYRLLETVRQYAREKLDETNDDEKIRYQHLIYYLKYAEEAEPHLYRTEQVDWLNRLELDHDNLRTALGWAKEMGRAIEMLQMATAMWWFWNLRSFLHEGHEWLMQGLQWDEETEIPSTLRAKALYRVAHLATYLGESTENRKTLLQESLDLNRAISNHEGCAYSLTFLAWLWDDMQVNKEALYQQALDYASQAANPWLVPAVLMNKANLMVNLGQNEQAVLDINECLRQFRKLGDRWGIAWSLSNFAGIYKIEENFDQANGFLSESRSLFDELGYKVGVRIVVMQQAILAFLQRNYEHAAKLCEENLTLAREVGIRKDIVNGLFHLGIAMHQLSDYHSAEVHIFNSLDLCYRHGITEQIPNNLIGLALVEAGLGKLDKAVQIFGAINSNASDIQFPAYFDLNLAIEQATESARAVLGEDAYNNAYAKGLAMSMDVAIHFALH